MNSVLKVNLIELRNSFKVPIEVPYFLLIFGFSFAESVTANLILYRICYVTLQFDESECALLGSNRFDNNTSYLEQIVQPHATNLFMIKSFVQTIVSLIPCIFLGPWSDKYGRRPLFLLISAGYTLSLLILTIFSGFLYASPWYYLISIVPLCVVGGFPVFMLALLSYITDTVPEENRAIRLGILEAVLTFGGVIATASSSFVLNATNYFAVYSISTISIFVSFLLTIFFIPESLPKPETKHKIRNLFDVTLLKDSIKTTFAKRPNRRRTLLLIVISSMVTHVIAVVADASLIFLYLRQKLHWSLAKFTLFNSGMHILAVVYNILGIYYLYKVMHIKESILILVGFLCLCIGSVIQGIAVEDWHIYLAGTISCFGSIINPMTRSVVATIIPQDDSGKVFSLIIIIDTLFSLTGVPIYTIIYNKTLSSFPGTFKLISAVIYIGEAFLALPMIRMQSQ